MKPLAAGRVEAAVGFVGLGRVGAVHPGRSPRPRQRRPLAGQEPWEVNSARAQRSWVCSRSAGSRHGCTQPWRIPVQLCGAGVSPPDVPTSPARAFGICSTGLPTNPRPWTVLRNRVSGGLFTLQGPVVIGHFCHEGTATA